MDTIWDRSQVGLPLSSDIAKPLHQITATALGNSFRVIGGGCALDARHVYRFEKIIEEADPDTFVIDSISYDIRAHDVGFIYTIQNYERDFDYNTVNRKPRLSVLSSPYIIPFSTLLGVILIKAAIFIFALFSFLVIAAIILFALFLLAT